jgi:hypothetical protein
MAKLLLSADQVESWRSKGFVVVDGFDVAAARDAAVFDESSAHTDFGSKSGSFEFPTGHSALDMLAIRMQPAVQQLLNCKGVYLSQADYWIKKPKPQLKQSNDDQRMHCDFGNNIIVPPPWDQPTVVSIIVYLDGEESCKGGGTAAVPRLGPGDSAYLRDKMVIQPGYGNRPFINNRADAEAWFEANAPAEAAFRKSLYERAINVMPKIGRVLLYRVDLWHRGTPLLGGSRRVMNQVWFSQAATGTGGRWNAGFWKSSYDWNSRKVYAAPDRLFEALSPDERMALGLPGVADTAFWNKENLAVIKARFPGFDPAPYEEHAKKKSKL